MFNVAAIESAISPTTDALEKPLREGEVSQSLNHQKNSCMELHRTIDALERRLESIMSPPKPEPSVPDCPTPPITKIHARINYNTLAVDTATKALKEIISRLEV